jgi:hypothetical protein
LCSNSHPKSRKSLGLPFLSSSLKKNFPIISLFLQNALADWIMYQVNFSQILISIITIRWAAFRDTRKGFSPTTLFILRLYN